MDLNSDPIIYIFWKHLNAGLNAFSNTNISSEDAYDRYEKLIKMGFRFLKEGFKENETENGEEKLTIENAIKGITEILLKRKRKIKVSLTI